MVCVSTLARAVGPPIILFGQKPLRAALTNRGFDGHNYLFLRTLKSGLPLLNRLDGVALSA